jgi:hypothetical protein
MVEYQPSAGSLAERAVRFLQGQAPYRGETWITTVTLAKAVRAFTREIPPSLAAAQKHGWACRRRHPINGVQWQAGPRMPLLPSQVPPDEEDDMSVETPTQRRVPAAAAPAPAALGPSSVFALGGGSFRPEPAEREEEERGDPLERAMLEDGLIATVHPASPLPKVPEPVPPSPQHTAHDGVGGWYCLDCGEFFPKHSCCCPHQPITAADLSKMKQATPAKQPFACALFSDGRLLIEVDGATRILPREHTEELVRYLAAVAAVERLAEGAAA